MKTVLVTGGAGGIGSAICKKFAQNGYSVIITFNSNAQKAQQLLEILNQYSVTKNHSLKHSVFHAPSTDTESVEKLKVFVADHYGHLDVLVNNAGITTPVAHDDLESLTDEWIDKIFQTNVRGSFAMIRAMKKLLIQSAENEAALVVNISSVASITGIGSNVAYCASKAAIDSITRSLGRALAPKIRVVSVSPGWVLGEYTQNIDPTYLHTQVNNTPLGRLAQPQDVASAVFALTESLTFCTGNIIPVDGGRPLK